MDSPDDFLSQLQSPFPLLPLRKGVLLPGAVTTLPVGRPKTLDLFRHLQPGAIIGVAVQKDGSIENPDLKDLHPVGVFARVRRVSEERPGWVRVVLEALSRFKLETIVGVDPYWTATGTVLPDGQGQSEESHLLAEALLDTIKRAGAQAADALQQAAQKCDAQKAPGRTADIVGGALGLEQDKELEVLLEADTNERLRLVTRRLGELQAIHEMRNKINDEVRRGIGKNQREAILREQLRAIKKELGEEKGDDFDALKKKLEEAGLPDAVREVVDRELTRYEAMSEMQAERGVIRNYLELIASLPWSKRADSTLDIEKVQAKLDADHFGLEDVKKRILEHLAVLKLANNRRGTILCLAGPPGVGKTSLGQSIADATGRPFVRVALGGVRDEAGIRGHRRTYVGALPGRIVNALKTAKVKNPVFLLDEIDKLDQGWMGSPEAALLEVLDPEQNGTFTDHYLELPFDLSEVLFICTANSLETLSAPLRDRLEIIEVSGYTMDEKFHIAKKHLIPKQLKEHGMDEQALSITDEALRATITGYTREAGVRQLQRQITKLCRAITLELARHPDQKAAQQTIEEKDLHKHLGKLKFWNDAAERTALPGVATGLAWTPVGGDILFVETSRMPGKGRIELTGQLGDVMKESARAALSFVRSNAEKLGVDPKLLETQDLHIHFPAGGVPKDGPSAGVTIFTALTSLFTGRRVRPDTAMTGECTLRGRVLPVGGIKEKVLAAHRAAIKRVILPKKNERDLEDVPKATREQMEFILAEDMTEVLAAALEDLPPVAGANAGGTDGRPVVSA
jgi:ATP-dependent Lon protease